MGIYRRLESNDGPVGVQGFAHLLRHAEEAIVREMAPPLRGEGCSAGWCKARPAGCSEEGSHCEAAGHVGFAAATGRCEARRDTSMRYLLPMSYVLSGPKGRPRRGAKLEGACLRMAGRRSWPNREGATRAERKARPA
jgi:hypothetical protein